MTCKTISAVAELRKACADTAALCDLFVFGSPAEVEAALSMLSRRVRILEQRVQRALTVLGEGGG